MNFTLPVDRGWLVNASNDYRKAIHWQRGYGLPATYNKWSIFLSGGELLAILYMRILILDGTNRPGKLLQGFTSNFSWQGWPLPTRGDVVVHPKTCSWDSQMARGQWRQVPVGLLDHPNALHFAASTATTAKLGCYKVGPFTWIIISETALDCMCRIQRRIKNSQLVRKYSK